MIEGLSPTSNSKGARAVLAACLLTAIAAMMAREFYVRSGSTRPPAVSASWGLVVARVSGIRK